MTRRFERTSCFVYNQLQKTKSAAREYSQDRQRRI